MLKGFCFVFCFSGGKTDRIPSTVTLKGAYTQWSVTSTEAYASFTLYLSLLITNNNIAPLGAQG